MSNLDKQVIDEAAQWMAFMQSGRAGDEDLQAFEVWRDSNPEHAQVIARMSGAVALVPLEALRKLPRSAVLASVNSASNRREFLSKGLSVLALGAVALSVGQWGGLVPLPGELQTRTGERGKWTLADGSVLTLNAQSRVVVNMETRQRSVTLKCGELLVDVARDRERPFVVKTTHGQIRALGTQFVVQYSDDHTRLVMLHSKTQIITVSGQGLVLEAGQAATFDGNGVLTVEAALGSESSWTDGLLEVRDLPLGSLVNELRKYRRGIIRLSAEAAALRVTGLYYLDDIDRTLHLLERSMPVSVVYHTAYWVSIDRRT